MVPPSLDFLVNKMNIIILAFRIPEDFDPLSGTEKASSIGSGHHLHYYIFLVGKGKQVLRPIMYQAWCWTHHLILSDLLYTRLGAGHTILFYQSSKEVAFFLFIRGGH